MNDLALFLTGNVDASVIDAIGANGLENNLNLSPFVAHHEAVQRMMSADILLFIIPKSERNKLIITGKLFEYLATGNPILGIGPTDGDASVVLQDANRNPLSDYMTRRTSKNSYYLLIKNGKTKKVIE